MTPAEWDTLADPLRLLAAVRRPDARKLRLLNVAAVRRSLTRFPLPGADSILTAAEAFADGTAVPGEMDGAHREALWLVQHHRHFRKGPVADALLELTYVVQQPGRCLALCREAESDAWGGHGPSPADPELAALVREVFGHPFRPVGFDPRWRTAAAVGLAATAYDTGDFAVLPILADALEEAGCDEPRLLDYLRDESAVHVRGCWAVDLVRGGGRR